MSIKHIFIGIILVLSFPLVCIGQDISTLRYNAEYRNDSWSQNKLGLAYENGEGIIAVH